MKFEGDISLDQELIKTIRGYSGYERTEWREKTDQRLREYMASQIQKIGSNFQNLSAHLQKFDNPDIARSIKRLIKQLKILIQSLHQPSYEKSSFFNLSEVNSGILTQLYEYESQIKHQVDILADEVSELENMDDVSDSGELINHLFDVVDNLNQSIMEREFLLAG
ncbi:hypothetical protein GF337_19925 [candidate division KSB1 bacterium]|nr:hypothetical protein [candidate division KSB1 bacterium]